MSHPLDDSLQDTMAHRWLLSPFRLFSTQLFLLLGGAILTLVLGWLIDKMGFVGARLELVVIAQGLLLSVAWFVLCTCFYKLLAAAEGAPHGVGWTVPWPELPARAAWLCLCWVAAQALLFLGVHLLSKLVGWIPARAFGGGSVFGWVIGLSLLFSMILPWAVLFGWTQLISMVLLVRTRLPVVALFTEAFGLLWRDPMRVVLPIGVITFVLCMFLALVLWIMGPIVAFSLVFRIPWWVWLIGNTVVAMWGLAMCFVLERVYLSELGGDPDAEPHSDISSSTHQARPVALSPLEQLRELWEKGDRASPQNVDAFVSALRRRDVSWRELQGWLAQCAPVERLSFCGAVARKLGYANQWEPMADVVQQGLSDDQRFLQDSPNVILAFARGLLSTGRHELALKLLAPFLREQRSHPDHLQAVLTSARLLLTHANKPELARKMLLHFQAMYPSDLQIVQLLKLAGG